MKPLLKRQNQSGGFPFYSTFKNVKLLKLTVRCLIFKSKDQRGQPTLNQRGFTDDSDQN